MLVRTDWTEKHWGNFPTYYMESPYCAAEAAQWLVDRGARAIGFDCFSEYCAAFAGFHLGGIHHPPRLFWKTGVFLMQQMTQPLRAAPSINVSNSMPHSSRLPGQKARPCAFLRYWTSRGEKNVTVKAYFLPESVEEAVGLLKDYGPALMISGGGTHTMMLINNGYALPEAVMGLRACRVESHFGERGHFAGVR